MEKEILTRYKMILFGDEKVGKTSLVNRFINNKFEEDYLTTLGYNVYEKRFQFGEYIVSLMIYDIGGQERFAELRKRYAEGANSALLVYDVTNQSSYDNIEKWAQELYRYVGPLPFVIIGNKIDLVNERKIDFYMGEKIFIDLGAVSFLETSAKTGDNVERAFQILAFETLRTHIQL
ncbi:MAG: GTP-binding protein [Candidatus Lokiarchaeota archaeon]|nr:GTP-binding protein [Candidatus Lokiarchaeota archaeon]